MSCRGKPFFKTNSAIDHSGGDERHLFGTDQYLVPMSNMHSVFTMKPLFLTALLKQRHIYLFIRHTYYPVTAGSACSNAKKRDKKERTREEKSDEKTNRGRGRNLLPKPL